MPKSALVYRVLIASPSDVSTERKIITDSIYSWNASHSMSTSAILEPVKWETHARPELGDRPQGIINKQLTEHCDLLIGVFWTRLGTSTGEAASGTVEEIEEFRETGRPVLLYFSSAPVVLASVDLQQYDALSNYKASLKTAGLYSDYENVDDFREQFQRHLASKMNQIHQPENKLLNTGALAEVSLPFPNITEQAKELLLEVSQDRHGLIAVFSSIAGSHIRTNGKIFGRSGNPRENARWTNALQQLIETGFLIPKGDKGEVFNITSSGFEYADMLQGIQIAATEP